MGNIFFGEREINQTIAAHASEQPSLDRLLQQGRDLAYSSQAKLEDKTPGNIRLTMSATDKPEVEIEIQAGLPRDTKAPWDGAKNEAAATFSDPSGRTLQRESVVITVPIQLPGPKVGANMTDTITDSQGHIIKKFTGSCSLETQTGTMDCRGSWRDGNNRFLVTEAFLLTQTQKLSNYYNNRGQLLGTLETSTTASDAGATASTRMR